MTILSDGSVFCITNFILAVNSLLNKGKVKCSKRTSDKTENEIGGELAMDSQSS